MSTTVHVLFFARAREIAGVDRLEIELDGDPRVGDVVDELRRRRPQLDDALRACRFAVNQEFSGLDEAVPEGAEVAVLPPVSGGCGPRSENPCPESPTSR